MNNNLTKNASDEAVNPRFCKAAVMPSCFVELQNLKQI
jgi:hypothetical protein